MITASIYEHKRKNGYGEKIYTRDNNIAEAQIPNMAFVYDGISDRRYMYLQHSHNRYEKEQYIVSCRSNDVDHRIGIADNRVYFRQ